MKPSVSAAGTGILAIVVLHACVFSVGGWRGRIAREDAVLQVTALVEQLPIPTLPMAIIVCIYLLRQTSKNCHAQMKTIFYEGPPNKSVAVKCFEAGFWP
jgi:hypothetical protein